MMFTKYLFKIGNIETYVYDEFTRELADSYDGVLKINTIENAIKLLDEYGNKYWTSTDALALLLYFMKKENVTFTSVIEKSEGL